MSAEPDRAAARRLAGFDAEAERRLAIYADVLLRWQRTINLVAPSTLPQLWTRHFADSWQVADAAPAARLWIDLGSGGGFPGLVTAIRLADTPGSHVHLIDSDRRKCAFLRDVSRETGAPVTVHAGRIEAVLPRLDVPDAVSARALAPLDVLLGFALPLIEAGAIGVFSKGKDAARELTTLGHAATIHVSSVASTTAADARLIVVRRSAPLAPVP